MPFTDAQKKKYWSDCMSNISSHGYQTNISKSDFRAAMDKMLDYFDANYDDSAWGTIVKSVTEKDPIDDSDVTRKVYTRSEYETKLSDWFTAHKANLRTEVLGLSIFADQSDLDKKISKDAQKQVLRDLLKEKLDILIRS